MDHILKQWFEDQLRFRLPDGAESDIVSVGSSQFSASEILSEFPANYTAEFDAWLDGEWNPLQHDRREEILNRFSNRYRYCAVREAISKEQVVPLIGSGMSVSSGLPTWSNFLTNVARDTHCDFLKLERLISSSSFEEAASLVANSMNPRLFAERIEQDLRITNPEIIDGPVRLLPYLFPRLVLTTNLDNVLEHVYKACANAFSYVLSGSNVTRYRQLRNPQERFLLKLHGDCQSPDDRVLLFNEYEAAYGPISSLRDELTLLYRHHSMLFLGCSLGADRTVQLIREAAAVDQNMPRHYALLASPASDNGRIDREEFLTSINVFPIWYDFAP